MFLCYVCLWKTVYQHYFASFVNTMLSTALHPAFHQTLVFALWLSFIVENHQLKFPLSEDNQLKKSIPEDIRNYKKLNKKQKTIFHALWYCLWKLNLIPRDKLCYRFYWHNIYCILFLKESEINFFAL